MTKHDAIRWPAQAAPRLRVAGLFPLDQRGFAMRYLAPTHAFHLHGYAGRVRIGRRTFELRPGDVTLTPAGVPSWYDLPAAGTHLCVHFRPEPVGRGPLTLPLHLRPALGRQTIERQAQVVADLFARGKRHAPAASSAMQALLACIAAEASEPLPAHNPSASDAALRRAAHRLETDLAEPLHVPTLAREVGLSQNYLARLFRQRYGVTLQRYRLRARVRHAELLLLTTDLTVKAIAAAVGLPDPQHFNKQFRRVTGVSPSAARGRRAGSAGHAKTAPPPDA